MPLVRPLACLFLSPYGCLLEDFRGIARRPDCGAWCFWGRAVPVFTLTSSARLD